MHVGLMVAAAVLIGGASAGADIVREGSGERRAALDRMELSKFPASWGDLSDWQGEPVSSATISGKPVLVVAWASWYPQSVRALSTAQRLADKYADKGLVVVGVHHKDGWEYASKALSSRNVSFAVAHDETGAFRDALRVDNDPDYYLIDRAGQLRYADVAPASLEEAVVNLVDESMSDAGSVEEIRAERQAAAAAQQETLRTINSEIDELADVEVPFIEPRPEEYQGLNWPSIDDEDLQAIGVNRASTSRRGNNEPPPEIRVEVPKEKFYPELPVLKGRVIAVYLWHPQVRSSYWPDMNDMDVLQRKYGRDLRVIGVMVPSDQVGDDSNDNESQESLVSGFDRFTAARNYDHTLVLDASGSLMSSFGSGGRRRSSSSEGANRLLLISSDGVLRWTGSINAFQGPLDRMLRVDPGVKARQAAERDYIEGRN